LPELVAHISRGATKVHEFHLSFRSGPHALGSCILRCLIFSRGWSWINVSGVSHSNLSWAPLPGPRAQRGVFVRATVEARWHLGTMSPRIFYPIVLDLHDYTEALARRVQEVLIAEAPFTLTVTPTPSQTHPTLSISTALAQLDPAPHRPTNFGHPHDDVPHHKLPQNFGGFAFGFGGVGVGGQQPPEPPRLWRLRRLQRSRGRRRQRRLRRLTLLLPALCATAAASLQWRDASAARTAAAAAAEAAGPTVDQQLAQRFLLWFLAAADPE
jgi:hypothetical protein